ncbi:MAG TPA: hypothetical protein VL096_21260 [Pirellulaceae bacterium]|nr:hypothetical protein [Pirellulaceae bacterium]
MRLRESILVLFAWLFTATLQAAPFEIRVVDDVTGRGVPLVELQTVNGLLYVTDSAGYVAFEEPGLLGERVYFNVRGHGYEVKADGFGFRGVALATKSGGAAEIKITRQNIAERLYRTTGQGIYADSVKLGRTVPLKQPVLNGLVLGQDSTQVAIYRGELRWFWGDTNRAAYPLGQFQTSGAVSKLPEQGGLAPEVGVDLTYFVDKEGFSRPMAPLAGPGPVWIDGLLTVTDDAGRERLVSHFSRMKDLGTKLEQGYMLYDDAGEKFLPAGAKLTLEEAWRFPFGQATLLETKAGAHWYFCNPAALTRVPAKLESVLDPKQYEAYAAVEDAQGKVTLQWTKDGPPVSQQAEAKLLKQGQLAPEAARLQLRAAASGKPIQMHTGTIRWNAYRQRFVMIVLEVGGTSHLGEVWYAEAPSIEGPWRDAVKIITHERYSFYNPVHHAVFDRDGGKTIYLEGTYTNTFSGNTVATPRYDYNQIMYRLDLSDRRLQAAHAKE